MSLHRKIERLREFNDLLDSHLRGSKTQRYINASRIATDQYLQSVKNTIKPEVVSEYITNYRQAISSTWSSADIGACFVEIDDFLKAVEQFRYENSFTASVISLFRELHEALNLLYKNPSNMQAALGFAATVESYHRIKERLGDLENELKRFEDEITFSPDSEDMSISLDLDVDISQYQTFAKKVQTIQTLYDKTLQLLRVKEHVPLKVVRIETGSLFATVAGHPLAVALMLWLIPAAAKFVYDRFSKSGKLERLPKKLEAAEKSLGLLTKLKEILPEEVYNEVATDNSEAARKIVSMALTETERLMEGVSGIQVNDDRVTYDNVVQDRLRQLEYKLHTIPRISEQDDDDEDEQSTSLPLPEDQNDSDDEK